MTLVPMRSAEGSPASGRPGFVGRKESLANPGEPASPWTAVCRDRFADGNGKGGLHTLEQRSRVKEMNGRSAREL